MTTLIDTNRETYFKLLDKMAECRVSIRTEARSLFPLTKAKYVRRGDGSGVIHLARERGGAWVEPTSSASDREIVFSGAQDVVEEISILAHELGHHHSTFQGYEEIRDRLDKDVSLATDAEKQSIYDEEVYAWDWARPILRKLGFSEMDRFEQIVAQSLDTYKGMWSSPMQSKSNLKHRKHYTTGVPPTTAIFQIMIKKPSAESGKEDYSCLGTGFFISKYGVFLTAKHVLDDEIEDSDGKTKSVLDFQGTNGLIALVILDGTGYPFAITDVAFHPVADIALGIAHQPLRENKPIVGLGISTCGVDQTEAPVGTKLLAYGFQRTKMGKDDATDTVVIDMNPQFYDGFVKEYYPNGFLLPKWAVYHTSVPLPSGISGCPLVNLATKGVVGISCTSLGGEPEDVEESTVTDIRLAFDMLVPEKLVGFSGTTVLDLLKSEAL